MVRFYLPLFLIFATGIAASFVGCEGIGGQGTREGRLQVWLKDSPSQEFDEFQVTIDRVELIGYGVDGESTLLVLSDQPLQYDLMDEGVTSLLIDTALPPGRYDQLRLVVREGANAMFVNGSRRNIPISSTAGLNVTLPSIEIGTSGDVVRMTVDFDIEQSFVELGSGSEYSFSPKLRAEEVLVNGRPAGVDAAT